VGDEIRFLEGVRVIESSLLEPASLGALLGELGADVVKVEPPGGGDYARRMAWPIIDGISILHWHCNRAKRSIVLDLRNDDAVEVYLELVKTADVVIEGMRPGALARRGITFERMREVNPRVVFCTLSGFGLTGPYRDIPSHGIAFDAWAGVAPIGVDDDGFTYIADHQSVGTKVAPVWAGFGVLAAVIRARATGIGCWIDVAQTDVAAAVNWLRIEGDRAYERPADEVTGNASDGFERRPVGVAGLKDAVRYQYYRTADSYVLFMASEAEFWENFCRGVDRADWFEARPGEQYADHAVGDLVLRRELQDLFLTRTTQEWVELGSRVNTPICPVNDSTTITADPQFRHRFPWHEREQHGTDLLPSPIHVVDGTIPPPARAPEPGQHSDEVLRDWLGYDADRVATLRASGALA
jgi:crotonobetainyl-CoA:carnitine CoA-transferase CaiB-like acyl-CoA transferase